MKLKKDIRNKLYELRCPYCRKKRLVVTTYKHKGVGCFNCGWSKENLKFGENDWEKEVIL